MITTLEPPEGAKAAPAGPNNRQASNQAVRTAVRNWLAATGDKGVARLYSHIQAVAAKPAEELMPALYLYWIVAQVSGQDNENRWNDVLQVSRARNIALNRRVDAEISSLLAVLNDGEAPALEGNTPGPVRIGQLKLFSEAARKPDEPSLKNRESNAWEKVDFSRLRRSDKLVFG